MIESRKLLNNIVLLALAVLTIFLFLELVFRGFGIKPYVPYGKLNVTPGGTLFKKHEYLGYTHLPGSFHVTFPDGYTVETTNLHSSFRATRTHQAAVPANRDKLWIFGCSYTYGYSLNDDETYPWIVQNHLSNYDVQNFGVTGYSTLQSLIQLKLAIQKKEIPKIVVLAYAPFHDTRNTFARSWRKSLSSRKYLGERNIPFVRATDGGITEIKYGRIGYWGLELLTRSSFLNYIDDRINIVQDKYFLKSSLATMGIITEFNKICKDNNIKFVVAIISNTGINANLIDRIKQQEIPVIDISVDMSIKANTNQPHDWHPSYKANQQYAIKLINGLKILNAI
ncbi:hypothetical protein [Geobacter sp. DSM 9736]|uniref:hypothetical protein n=1 Tax=Geobacter sp. DSM 9736 TaxID=1277350 RepID=UPI000B50FD26|nr:hypothetical protein [Geobacter sp. DSM 9736]SNB46627.1 hypothetical protein SAMN06269301_2095 [Geobacter sp. DSM 9736]